MDNPGIKSWSTIMTFNVVSTTASYNNFNLLAGNGFTTISPLVRDVLIKGVEASCKVSPRVANNLLSAGGQATNFEVNFYYVNFAGQVMNQGNGFNNLFVPDPNISAVGLPANFRSSLNDKVPKKDVCVNGGGIYIDSMSVAAGASVAGPTIVEFTITIWYLDY